jgi:hypothetical protein
MCETTILAASIIILIIILIYLNKTDTNKAVEGFTCGESGNAKYINSIKGFSGLTDCSSTPWTIDKPTKLIITDIIRKILNEVNKQTGMTYYFTAYDQLKKDIISDMETRFVADIFVHELKNLFTRRILMVFTVNFANKNVQVEHINLSNAFKLPEKSFMDYPASNLILQDDNLLAGEYHIMGRNSSKLDFSILMDKDSPPKTVPTPTEFQKWILPMGIAAAYQNPQAIFPSRKQSTCWDTAGVNYIEPQSELQLGVRNTPLTRYPYPYFNPTVNNQREYNTEYKWMFDLADNRSGAGRGVAGSP